MDTPKYTLSNDTITFFWEGRLYTFKRGTPQFEGLRDVILEERWEDAPKHLSFQGALSAWSRGEFLVEGDSITYKGEVLPEELTERILSMIAASDDPEPLFRFWERLDKNPSNRSKLQTFRFLKHFGIPITTNGFILAYKSVTSNLKDHHTQSVDNSIGAKPEMDRNKVSDDPRVACHDGYHVGALEYASTFGGQGSRIVICKIDPKDVVCVPYDHSDQKMRCCAYEVIGFHNGSRLSSTVFYDEDELLVQATKKPSRKAKKKVTKKAKKKVTKKAAKKVAKKPVAKKTEKPGKKVTARDFRKYKKRDLAGLMECSVEELRKYATYLKIVGASKIPGGKATLVAKILEVRGHRHGK